jgi:hypothetical protein
VKTEFPLWFQYKVKTDCTNELRALVHGPLNAYCYTACIVNGVRFVVHDRDVQRTTQNSGVVTLGEDGTPFYGQLEQIIELNYISGYSAVLFRCKWFDTSAKGRVIKKNNIVVIDVSREMYVGSEWYDDQQYILATQARQVFYLQDPSRTTGNWRVVEDVHHRNLWDHPSMVVGNGIDVLHDSQSTDYNLDARSIEDEIDGGHDTQPLNLVVDLGSLPIRTSLGEGGASSSIPLIVDDDSFIDDDEEEVQPSDNEDEISDDFDDNDDVEVIVSSDDSE